MRAGERVGGGRLPAARLAHHQRGARPELLRRLRLRHPGHRHPGKQVRGACALHIHMKVIANVDIFFSLGAEPAEALILKLRGHNSTNHYVTDFSSLACLMPADDGRWRPRPSLYVGFGSALGLGP